MPASHSIGSMKATKRYLDQVINSKQHSRDKSKKKRHKSKIRQPSKTHRTIDELVNKQIRTTKTNYETENSTRHSKPRGRFKVSTDFKMSNAYADEYGQKLPKLRVSPKGLKLDGNFF